MIKKEWIVGLALLVAVVLVLINRNNKTYNHSEGSVWITQYHITYESDVLFDDSIQMVFRQVDNSVSKFNKASLISRINAGERVKCDNMLQMLYTASQQVNKVSRGAFDPTVAPLMNAWGFVSRGGNLPSPEEIDSIMAFVGIGKTTLTDGYIVKTDERVQFDFSAIAKGFACDEVGRMLERNGVTNYLVEIGGEIACAGVNPRGTAWGIMVDYPMVDSVTHEDGVMVLSLNKGAVATSGNYRNFKVVDGKKVVHTMNPRTGYSEQSNLLSATVVAESCMLADAYATACMVMGVEQAKEVMDERSDLGVLLVYSTHDSSIELWMNHRFKEISAK